MRPYLMGLILRVPGAYHIEGPFFSGNSNYTIRAQIVSINAQPPQNQIVDKFSLKTVA